MNTKRNASVRDEEDIIIFDPTDDQFDDELDFESSYDFSKDPNFEKHEIWDEVDGEWFTCYMRKGTVTKTDEQLHAEANTWQVTASVILGILSFIVLAIWFSIWLHS